VGTFPLSGINMSNLIEALEKFFKTTVDYRGRIYVPKQVRRRLLIKDGDRVYIKIENDHFKVYTAKALKSQTEEKDRKQLDNDAVHDCCARNSHL